jgi:hypothetical protein
MCEGSNSSGIPPEKELSLSTSVTSALAHLSDSGIGPYRLLLARLR